jgi:eukaryotic-like serine/threonine-protein kinase
MALHPNDMTDDPDPTEILPARSPLGVAGEEGTLATGVLVGRYRIDSLLGRGGMGEVYRAEQLEPVRRTVALKLLRGQRLEARHLAYFEVERQMLAQMRHPGIAQVYDAGATTEGFPYFAMEFIDGTPVTRYAEEHALPLRQRVELFIRICQGVQHAHQKGVIHRDLKPGNLLVDEVDGKPVPKIIDFGIATAATRGLAGDSLERAGTPEYMSPEQAGADPASVDTRSDVYSLGVVLYELLAGVRPGAMHETIASAAATLRLPSEQLSILPRGQVERLARAQGLSVPGMRKLLRGELDWIVLKAMRHERGERYASAADLGDDLQRFLEGRPVQAVPASKRYRWGKFARRHRVALVAASLVLCALLGGLGVSLYGLMEAREQRAVAERRSTELGKVAAFQQSMLEDIDIEAMGIGMADGLRKQIADAEPSGSALFDETLARASTADLARDLIDRNLLAGAESAIEQDFANEPELANRLRESVARVQVALGLGDKAAENFRKVADYRGRISGEGHPDTLQVRQQQAGALLAAARTDEAGKLLARALPLALALPVNDRTRVKLELAQAMTKAANGDHEAAKSSLQALYSRLVAAVGEKDPASMEVLNELASVQRAVGDIQDARANMEKLVPLRRQVLGEDHEDTLASLGNLSILRMVAGEQEGAVELQHQLVQLQTRRLGSEHPVTLHARSTLATMMVDSGQAEEAIPLLQSALAARVRVIGADHPQTIRTRLNLATAYARLHEYDKALAVEEDVIEARTRVLGRRHPDTVAILVNHAGTLLRDHRARECLSLLATTMPLAREVLGVKHPRMQEAMLILAEASMMVGDHAVALDAFRELFATRLELLGADHHETIVAAWNLVDAYEQTGRPEAAKDLRKRYMAPLLATNPATLTEPLARLAEAMHEGRRPGKLE